MFKVITRDNEVLESCNNYNEAEDFAKEYWFAYGIAAFVIYED